MGRNVEAATVYETLVRMVLLAVVALTEKTPTFERRIQPEELWMYKNPRTPSYVSTAELTLLVFVIVPAFMGSMQLWTKDKADASQCFWGYSLACGLCGAVTNVAKVIIGRPRPDFFYRCFPDGIATPDMTCTGNPADVLEGRKSFPSGHSAWGFAAYVRTRDWLRQRMRTLRAAYDCYCMYVTARTCCSLGFAAWYISGKLHTFGNRGVGSGWRLMCSLTPLLCATAIALSRTCDYHHHWQDVVAGASLGLLSSYVCYRRYYPALDHPLSEQPLIFVSLSDEVAQRSCHRCQESIIVKVI